MTNVQLTNAGDYTVVVTNGGGSATSHVAHLQIDATFTKVTTGAIVNDLGLYARAAWGDFNNDGFLDLFVSYYGGTNVFYRNKGDGTFTKITQGDPVRDADEHTGTAAADYDNDGYLDLIVLALDCASTRRNKVYHNNGDGSFSRVSGGALTNELAFFHACAWADYDNDGFVDLFITNVGQDCNGGKCLLFHNNGDGAFTKVISGSVVRDISAGDGTLWADYDNDGFMDLIVINGLNNGHNLLYHNERNGTFARVLTNAVATDSWLSGAEGGAWGDYDNDGFLDLFVTDWGATKNRLYHNNGGGTFTNLAAGPMLFPPPGGAPNGAAWGDYDNDGFLDLYVTYVGTPSALFRNNNGDGTFTQILTGSPANEGGGLGFHSKAVAWVDYDKDGFLDLFVTRSNENFLTPNFLYHNNGNTNGWLEVQLVGTASNRSAIGAKVRVRATIGGKTFWQLREINTGGGWNLQPLVAHFGLSSATNVDLLRIEWPSGIVQTMTDVAARQFLTVEEHQLGAVAKPSFTSVSRAANGSVDLSVTGDPGWLHVFEASTDLGNWTKVGVRSNATGVVEFTDSKATNYTRRFYRVSIP